MFKSLLQALPPPGFHFDNVKGSPIIAVVDADSFEVQNYQKLSEYADTKGYPCVVADKIIRKDGTKRIGKVIAVSPEAKDFEISRLMAFETAQQKCPALKLIPRARRYDKPDDQINRLAYYKIRKEIMDYIENLRDDNHYYTATVPIAKNGSDEFFLDLTKLVDIAIEDGSDCYMNYDEPRKVIIEEADGSCTGHELFDRIASYYYEQDDEDFRLVVAAQIMDKMMQQIQDNIGYDCSAGIGNNRVIAKIACKLNKPKGVTALTEEGLERISENFNFRDITGFGGELGTEIETLWRPMSMAELRRRVEGDYEDTVATFGAENTSKILELANGRCSEKVEHRFMDAMLSCSKNNLRFSDVSNFTSRLELLAEELIERIKEEEEHNKRRPTKIQMEYTIKFSNTSKKVCKFPLSIPLNENDEIENLTASAVYKQAVEESVTKNPDFEKYLRRISKMRLKVTKFKIFEVFYEDELLETGVFVHNFMAKSESESSDSGDSD